MAGIDDMMHDLKQVTQDSAQLSTKVELPPPKNCGGGLKYVKNLSTIAIYHQKC